MTLHISDELDYQWPCYKHATRQTSLRCYRPECENPICVQCAVRTRVGYLCKDCKKGLEARHYHATKGDYIVGGSIALLSGFITGALIIVLAVSLSFFFLLFLVVLGQRVGHFVARTAFRSVRGRRGEYLPQFVANGLVAGLGIAVFFGVLMGTGVSLWIVAVAGIYGYAMREAVIKYLH